MRRPSFDASGSSGMRIELVSAGPRGACSHHDGCMPLLSPLARLAVALLVVGSAGFAADTTRPNIVIILADDLGFGDTGCYGATAVKTPHVDRLAREGRRFTSVHATAATCTPSRYSIMTGEYAFRQEGTGVLPGDAALIIASGRPTLASVLHDAGYVTGAVGKWHLGLGTTEHPADWNGRVAPGPLEVGFDYSFIMAATGDRVPCVYVEDHGVAGLNPADPIRVSYRAPFPGEPLGTTERASLRLDWSEGHNQAIVNGVGRIGYMTGGRAALWRDEDMADTFAAKAVGFIERNRTKPFFLYFATHGIHVPRVPHPRFVGATAMGPRGDAIAEFDDTVGQVLSALEKSGLEKNTIVILTSDNGPVLDDGYRDGAVEKLGAHRPAGPWRGGKYSLFEAGTRVPFIVRWPGHVPSGGTSDALISQVDLLATFAALTGRPHPGATARDSRDLGSAMFGQAARGRDHLLEHAGSLGIRVGDWKFIPPARGAAKNAGNETGKSAEPQLYDLTSDPGERTNLAKDAAHAGRLAEMSALLERERARRSPSP